MARRSRAKRNRTKSVSPFKTYPTRRSKLLASDANKKIIEIEEESSADERERDESGGERMAEEVPSQRVSP